MFAVVAEEGVPALLKNRYKRSSLLSLNVSYKEKNMALAASVNGIKNSCS
jgi:hypothetical protein